MFSSGPEGGKSFSSPIFDVLRYNHVFQDSDLNGGSPQEFKRVTGHHTIEVTHNGSTWSFPLTGGTNRILSTIDTGNDFRIASDDNPRGCTVTTLSPPTNSTRTNRFEVVENLSGGNITLIFSYCPTMGIPSTVEYPTGQPPLTGDVVVKVIFFRLIDTFRGTGLFLPPGAPEYSIISFTTNFNSSGGSNPLDSNTALPFSRVTGQQEIIVENTDTNFFFSFFIDYGIVGQAAGYVGFSSSPLLTSTFISGPENATLDNVSSNRNTNPSVVTYTFTTAAPDNRNYEITIYPHDRQPTIRLTSGSIGAENIRVQIKKAFFNSI